MSGGLEELELRPCRSVEGVGKPTFAIYFSGSKNYGETECESGRIKLVGLREAEHFEVENFYISTLLHG